MPSLEGSWTTELSGGLPPLETWSSNPQFAVYPGVDNASYTVELVRHGAGGSQVRAGLWIMKADAPDERKTEFTGMVQKTNVSTNERRSLTLDLPPRKGGLPYIVSCATHEAGQLGSFTLTVSSVEDEGVRVVPLQEAAAKPNGRPASAKSALAPIGGGGPAPSAPQPLGDFTPSAPPPLKKGGTQFAFGETPPDNQPTIDTLGQGLSKKLLAESAERVKAASAAAQASGGLYEDPEFPASDASLGADAGSYGVVSWRRIGEIEPPKQNGGLLEDAEGVGVSMGSLKDEWLLGALNVVAGNVDVVERTFVDMQHAEQGFYAVRVWAEDPSSDDDWAVVLVDDRIPCGADGMPAFGHGAKAGALWLCLVEKAVAKRYGSYAALAGDGGGEATVRGLELITGGKARQLPFPSDPLNTAEALDTWGALKEALEMNEVVAARCDVGTPAAAAAEAVGIVPGRTYCVIVANDLLGGGQQLMRLRGFAGDAEWNGKWSDDSKEWTSRLRQMLAYSKNANDGTFWMAFDDFVKHFTSAYANKVADDQWNRIWMKSRWMDITAGGGPGYSSWRDNYQWLLTLPRDTHVTLELSLPDPRLSSDSLLAVPPIGMLLVQGNGGANARRRKLQLLDAGEVVFHAEPRATRRYQMAVQLPASPPDSPYVLVPYTTTPGAESPFKLSILVDDLDEDGKADITLEPLLPNPPNPEDWATKRKNGPWSLCAAAPNMAGFSKNDRVAFTLAGGSTGATEGRVIICVETIGLNLDMRLTEGMQQSAEYPQIGVAVMPNADAAPTDALPSNVKLEGPAARDGVWLEVMLPVGGAPHVVVPFLAVGESVDFSLQYALTIYSELPLEGAQVASVAAANTCGEWDCETCEGGHGYPCPFRCIIEKMDKMEALMDERLQFLETLG